MMTDHPIGRAELERYNLTAEVDWRFQRISRIRQARAGMEALNRFDDRYVRAALRFVLREEKWRRDEMRLPYGPLGKGERKNAQMIDTARRNLLPQYLHLYNAFSMGLATEDGRQAIIQAHLWAGRSDDESSARR